jgi:hypothetical protein
MATTSGVPPTVFDLEINLSSLSTSTANSLSTFVNRSSPIVLNPSDYYVSVSRFICSTQLIPLWSPVLNTTSGLNDGYNTIYSITLTYGALSSDQTYLRVINTLDSATAPATPVLTQPTNGWGYVYSYYTICDMINTALTTAYTQLATLAGGELPDNPPYMGWENQTQLFTMNCYPMSFYDQSSGDEVINIYFNNNYRQYLLGWDFIAESSNVNTPTGIDNLLNVRNTGNNYSPQSDPPTYTPSDPDVVQIQFSQSVQAPWAFCSLAKLQIVASLPIAYPTLSALPLANVGNSNNNSVSPILCDFLVNYSSGGASSFTQPISYFPSLDSYSSPIKLSGASVLNSFSVGVNWMNLEGQSFPLSAFGTTNSSIKLTFTHKSLIESGL